MNFKLKKSTSDKPEMEKSTKIMTRIGTIFIVLSLVLGITYGIGTMSIDSSSSSNTVEYTQTESPF